ncbi:MULTISPECIES: hypothetical protein [unclassified Agrobacterium]|uniref:hypothetical protein n=1 Tax=unclassified Agrobacterium TaxID=2632611 RepID=UPI0024488422|nr:MULTISPECIES: hypothetical protein [unclassified Agrobacterium]MDH0616913.1 hypothetical protein [Agrobacterium sp. GD03872]MDH0699643.1 hypothetical protein [Agrobacterium sp. GD03871]MDH1062234.1 hypothetical protein [Agrobacterium sp. GD03992]MDH2211307.1 hypothetical protein [Agrobacterium sp. GD03643]MDH2222027.1 hypothetical protein [Agrobacterium sp. GD03638]
MFEPALRDQHGSKPQRLAQHQTQAKQGGQKPKIHGTNHPRMTVKADSAPCEDG